MEKNRNDVLSDINALSLHAKISSMFQQAATQFQQGHLEEAEKLAREILDIDPDHAEINHMLGLIASKRGNYDTAEMLLAHAITINPHNHIYFINLASVLERMGREDEALNSYAKAIQISPQSAEAHCNMGVMLIRMRRFDEAKKSLDTALRCNPELAEARYFLSSIDAGVVPPEAPRDYVTKLFDSYAERFDNDLVTKLGYQTPKHLFAAVCQQIGSNTGKIDVLDLGCGTGLCGIEFAGLANHMIGVDLSPQMLGKARETGCYTDLIQADICDAFKQFTEGFDLVISGDVFVYMGALEKIFQLVGARLNAGGLFAFSIEDNGTCDDYLLRVSGRYAHSVGYIRRLAKNRGLEMLNCDPVILRHNHGNPVMGNIIVLRSSRRES